MDTGIERTNPFVLSEMISACTFGVMVIAMAWFPLLATGNLAKEPPGKNVQNCIMMRIVLLGLDVNGNWKEALTVTPFRQAPSDMCLKPYRGNQPYGTLNRTMESRDYSKPVCAIVPLDLSRRP
jgi:hypothetical protein